MSDQFKVEPEVEMTKRWIVKVMRRMQKTIKSKSQMCKESREREKERVKGGVCENEPFPV
jgi:hypothetical protein